MAKKRKCKPRHSQRTGTNGTKLTKKGGNFLSNQINQSQITNQSENSTQGHLERLTTSNMASPFASVDEFYAPSAIDLLAMLFILLWMVLVLFQLISIAAGWVVLMVDVCCSLSIISLIAFLSLKWYSHCIHSSLNGFGYIFQQNLPPQFYRCCE